MEKRVLTKPDGRRLILYARNPFAPPPAAPSPALSTPSVPHLRWHPLRGEWVAYATHRQDRTFLPGAEYNPLAPAADPARPTEVPEAGYDVAVFENLFPTFAAAETTPPNLYVPTRPARGACEVVVFTRDPKTSLGALPLWHLELILEVWADRYRELAARPEVAYVFPFENRGVEVGVTLTHPHGQIYAYPFVPPIPARELALQAAHLEKTGTGLLETLVAEELAEGSRMLYAGDSAAAFLPVFARYAYEVWVAPRRAVPSSADLDGPVRHDFARALQTVLRKFDALWGRPFPYVMVFHQAPTDGAPHPEAHFHIELYPAYRKRDRLKFLAGSELGAGVFTADTLPEEKAAELQAVKIELG